MEWPRERQTTHHGVHVQGGGGHISPWTGVPADTKGLREMPVNNIPITYPLANIESLAREQGPCFLHEPAAQCIAQGGHLDSRDCDRGSVRGEQLNRRRRTSDFETFHREASNSRSAIVERSRELVDFIFGMAILNRLWPFARKANFRSCAVRGKPGLRSECRCMAEGSRHRKTGRNSAGSRSNQYGESELNLYKRIM